MGKTAALGLKLLWTMGCPPTKITSQKMFLPPPQAFSAHTFQLPTNRLLEHQLLRTRTPSFSLNLKQAHCR
ncbi:unnamed protein product [Pleuronectes platessa]|uniref:Uncharacterized protein n=1 Tax=Pleuronectes platessa TaxID=8262 RepID=A0A9N7ZE04_PLEPL|nr:unnamed protein product [Pleuronectes platessa]